MVDIIKSISDALQNLIKTMSEYCFDDLMEYGLDYTSGAYLVDVYKKLADMALNESFIVTGEEISDGKYRIYFNPDAHDTYMIHSKASFTKIDILEVLLTCLIIPYIKNQFRSKNNPS
jgi:hypothetical protein